MADRRAKGHRPPCCCNVTECFLHRNVCLVRLNVINVATVFLLILFFQDTVLDTVAQVLAFDQLTHFAILLPRLSMAHAPQTDLPLLERRWINLIRLHFEKTTTALSAESLRTL